MKLVSNTHPNFHFDNLNYAAIAQLELLGILEPTETQISYMEEILRVSLMNTGVKLQRRLMLVKK